MEIVRFTFSEIWETDRESRNALPISAKKDEIRCLSVRLFRLQLARVVLQRVPMGVDETT